MIEAFQQFPALAIGTALVLGLLIGSFLDIASLREILNRKGQELELQITVQHEDIFNFMHRI